MYARKLKLLQHSGLLLGPRQTGKTTFIKAQLTQYKVFMVDLLIPDVFYRYSSHPQYLLDDIQSQIKHQGVTHCFIDEIQKLPGLLDVVHHLVETKACTFLLTGSSARKLKRKGTNLLGGRALQYFLFPLIYNEFKADFVLADVLQFGSLPALVKAPQELVIKTLQTYVQTYLKEEIKEEGLVRNLGAFQRFLEVAASQSGDLLSYQNVAQACQVAAKTVTGFYEILEDTLLGFRLEPWRKSLKKRMVAHPKFYLFDTGVTNALNGRLTQAIDPKTKGRLFEQLMILESYRLLHYLGSEAKLYYWRTSNGSEVDLLIEKHGRFIAAVEFKANASTSARDCSGLWAFLSEYPETPAFLVCDAPYINDQDRIVIWPWRVFLENLETLL